MGSPQQVTVFLILIDFSRLLQRHDPPRSSIGFSPAMVFVWERNKLFFLRFPAQRACVSDFSFVSMCNLLASAPHSEKRCPSPGAGELAPLCHRCNLSGRWNESRQYLLIKKKQKKTAPLFPPHWERLCGFQDRTQAGSVVSGRWHREPSGVLGHIPRCQPSRSDRPLSLVAAEICLTSLFSRIAHAQRSYCTQQSWRSTLQTDLLLKQRNSTSRPNENDQTI